MRILIIDDSENDIELIKAKIDSSGIAATFSFAMTKVQIETALKQNEFDIIICDYELQDTNALWVLAFYKLMSLEIPFIGTSGVVTEQKLVELVKAGAHSFFLKKDLDLLPNIILNERKDFFQRMEKKEAEENLNFIGTLKARGELLGRPAEEFSRMFNSIIGNLHIAQGEKMDAVAAKAIASALEAANKALKIAINMLISSGKTVRTTDSIDLSKFFEDNAYYFSLLVPKSIKLSINVPPGLPKIMGDEMMLRHALGAIVVNSVEATDYPRENSINIQVTSDEKEVIIRIEDTGTGIDKEILNQVFDPFFTTKIRSCGLGLASAFGVAAAHNGHIEINSVLNAGTKVLVHLPRPGKI